MSPGRIGVYVVAAMIGVCYRYMQSMDRIGNEYEHVQEVLNRVRAVQEKIQISSLNMTVIENLKSKHFKWRNEWKKLLEHETINQQEIALHWQNTKKQMLEYASKKQFQLVYVQEHKEKILNLLSKWKSVRADIETTTIQIEKHKITLQERQNENEKARKDAIARGVQVVQRQRDRDEYKRMLQDEAASAHDSVLSKRRVLYSTAIAGAIIVFGMIMIAFDRYRKEKLCEES